MRQPSGPTRSSTAGTRGRSWPARGRRAGDPFADWINAVEKHVVSDTLSEADLTWGPTSLIRGADLVAAVHALRERPGGDVNVMGSAQLVRSLLEADLVDELHLMIEPIVLGGGKGIFPADGATRRFELVSALTAGTGVQVCRCQRTRGGAASAPVRAGVALHPALRLTRGSVLGS